MIEIRSITRENPEDLNLKNEPFEMPGRFIPTLTDGVWTYRTELFASPRYMVFPDENYDIDTLSENSAIFGAYENGKCLGIAIYQEAFFKYYYLYDLKVCAAARGMGIGRALIETGMAEAKRRGYIGLYTQAQDNNLNACMFYLKTGFSIGGFDNRLYDGTTQAGKADIIFYKKD